MSEKTVQQRVEIKIKGLYPQKKIIGFL